MKIDYLKFLVYKYLKTTAPEAASIFKKIHSKDFVKVDSSLEFLVLNSGQSGESDQDTAVSIEKVKKSKKSKKDKKIDLHEQVPEKVIEKEEIHEIVPVQVKEHVKEQVPVQVKDQAPKVQDRQQEEADEPPSKKQKQIGARFQRIDKSKIDQSLVLNNEYTSTFAEDSYGFKAHQDLIVTRGKGFTKEKNKKKKGIYRGGVIGFASNSFKYDDD